jgi:GT2 family glycosyltransferase
LRSQGHSAGAGSWSPGIFSSGSFVARSARVLPSLSIVIPSHKRTDLLADCLRSVMKHAPARTQVVVVDDGSPAGSVYETARGFDSVEVVRLAQRGGFSTAADCGVRQATGVVVELLNDDTEVSAGWAGPALEAFLDPRVGAVAPLVLCPGEGGPQRVDSAGDRYYWGGIAGKRGHRKLFAPGRYAPGSVFGASGSSAFLRREAFLRVGGFPEQFGAYFEDIDLAFRLHRAGYEVRFEPRSRIMHRISASYGKPARSLLEQQSLNEERVFWRNLPGPELLQALPHHLAVLAAKTWQRWRTGGLAPFLCGRLRILSEVRELIRHRQWLGQLGPRPQVQSWGVERSYWGAGL